MQGEAAELPADADRIVADGEASLHKPNARSEGPTVALCVATGLLRLLRKEVLQARHEHSLVEDSLRRVSGAAEAESLVIQALEQELAKLRQHETADKSIVRALTRDVSRLEEQLIANEDALEAVQARRSLAPGARRQAARADPGETELESSVEFMPLETPGDPTQQAGHRQLQTQVDAMTNELAEAFMERETAERLLQECQHHVAQLEETVERERAVRDILEAKLDHLQQCSESNSEQEPRVLDNGITDVALTLSTERAHVAELELADVRRANACLEERVSTLTDERDQALRSIVCAKEAAERAEAKTAEIVSKAAADAAEAGDAIERLATIEARMMETADNNETLAYRVHAARQSAEEMQAQAHRARQSLKQKECEAEALARRLAQVEAQFEAQAEALRARIDEAEATGKATSEAAAAGGVLQREAVEALQQQEEELSVLRSRLQRYMKTAHVVRKDTPTRTPDKEPSLGSDPPFPFQSESSSEGNQARSSAATTTSSPRATQPGYRGKLATERAHKQPARPLGSTAHGGSAARRTARSTPVKPCGGAAAAPQLELPPWQGVVAQQEEPVPQKRLQTSISPSRARGLCRFCAQEPDGNEHMLLRCSLHSASRQQLAFACDSIIDGSWSGAPDDRARFNLLWRNPLVQLPLHTFMTHAARERDSAP